MAEGIQLVVADLGSNSFHLIVAELYEGRLRILHHLREQVQLANGLTENNELTPEAQQRALDCLTRFGEFTRNLPPENVAIVGTYTLRKAEHIQDFLTKAQEVLGHPIDIISGDNEARFIYHGVLYTSGISHQPRLIIDIGGGSTELIIGKDTHPLLVHSIDLGCVRLARKFFKIEQGTVKWSSDHFQQAYNAACKIFTKVREPFLELGWKETWGTSGTLDAALHVLMAHQWADKPSFSAHGLEKLRHYLSSHPELQLNKLPGLTPERASVFSSGLSILCAFFDVFEIEEIRYASGGLREGLLYLLALPLGLDSSQLIVHFV